MTDVSVDQGDLATIVHENETLQEALSDYLRSAAVGARDLLRQDEAGWRSIGADQDEPIEREKLLDVMAQARVMAVADPLIKRAVTLRTAYVWGRGVAISAKQEDGAEQDVNAVVQAFLDDPSNRDTFAGQQAQHARERMFATDGNLAISLITDPLYGRVQVRPVPLAQIVDRVTNPEDEHEAWLFKREYRARVVEPGTIRGTTRTRWETRRVYYPALGFSPTTRAKIIDGIPVEWDKPVLHVAVNAIGAWGVPDAYAALPWARAYKEFLTDWARIARALSRFAFQATAKTKTGASQVRTRLAAAAVDPATGQTPAGQTAITAEGQRFEAIGKSGATIDSDSGLPLAAMVGSALGIPVTILTANPTTTGARATADTLDAPMRTEMKLRQDLHAEVIRRVLGYVIDQAVKAPRGALRGTVRRDQVTGQEVVELAGGQDRTIDVAFPDVSEVPLKDLMAAVVAADGMDVVPPLVIAKLVLTALEVDDVDAVLAEMTDDDGNFVPPQRDQHDPLVPLETPSGEVPAEAA